MAYSIEVRPLAAMEIIEAFDWYELQREGLGIEFLDEIKSFYDGLLRNPQSHSYYDEPVRQGKINRFPYTIVYETIDAVIVIYSVFMTSQNPSKKRTK